MSYNETMIGARAFILLLLATAMTCLAGGQLAYMHLDSGSYVVHWVDSMVMLRVVSCAVLLVILSVILARVWPHALTMTGIALLLGAVAGNITEAVFRGGVVDYIPDITRSGWLLSLGDVVSLVGVLVTATGTLLAMRHKRLIMKAAHG